MRLIFLVGQRYLSYLLFRASCLIPTITGLIMLGGSQVLDGAKWKNVVFFNTHIVYRDGNATLDGIRFVNCTFDLPENERGTQLANYAALEKHFLAL